MHQIGEDRTERLDIVLAQLRVIATVRPRYACRSCSNGVVQAPAPTHLIVGGLPTEGAIAHVLVSKYADHLPLYRQSQIMARSGLDLHRATLADWVGKAAFHFKPIVDRMAEELKKSTKLFMECAGDPGPWWGQASPAAHHGTCPGSQARVNQDRVSMGAGAR